jgi:hypothetical protein
MHIQQIIGGMFVGLENVYETVGRTFAYKG